MSIVTGREEAKLAKEVKVEVKEVKKEVKKKK